MIRPLRQRHRRMVCALGVMLPLAFVVGIAARRPVPAATMLPPQLTSNADRSGQAVWTKSDLWQSHRIATSLRRDGAGGFALEFSLHELNKPDVLVYWVGGKQTTGDRLPENAILLGGLVNAAVLPIPPSVQGQTGNLVLYSLADHEIVAVSNPVTF